MAELGLCKLTKLKGKMAKCHLLPQAFTRPEINGHPFIQIAVGEYPTRRRTSWYGKNLVINEGESILGRIDDWGIKFLRRKRLVWSGWPVMSQNAVFDGQEVYRHPNTRKIHVDDPVKLRIFLLSLLWRAAATSLPDFSEIKIPEDHIEKLRQIVIGESPDDPLFYGCNFFQLSTVGPIHNMTPIRRVFEKESIRTDSPSEIFRFYFDGLVIWFNTEVLDASFFGNNVLVGTSNDLIFPTHPFSGSWAESNMHAVIQETHPLVMHSGLAEERRKR